MQLEGLYFWLYFLWKQFWQDIQRLYEDYFRNVKQVLSQMPE